MSWNDVPCAASVVIESDPLSWLGMKPLGTSTNNTPVPRSTPSEKIMVAPRCAITQCSVRS